MTIVAAAGRRIDASDAPVARFPLSRADAVKNFILDALEGSNATALVSSAACGADLLAQEVAAALQLSRRVILPFDTATFRSQSVVDRPGDWGPRFDQLLTDLGPDALEILHLSTSSTDAFTRTNTAILDKAQDLGRLAYEPVIAVVVWEQQGPRGPDDVTAHFNNAAIARGLPIVEIPTL